jgi:hypothetical protein
MQLFEGTNRTGMIQLLEDWTGTESSSNYTRQVKTRDLNLGLDDYMSLSIPSSGTWQADDFNHTRYPNFTFDIVSGQQDYNFDEDEQGNKILDIYRVEIKDANGVKHLITPYNEMAEESSIWEQESTTGTPTRAYKVANGIFFDPTPNYNSTNGGRIWYARTPKYFTVASGTSDDTTEPGIPNSHHVYPVLWATYNYWLPLDTAKANLYGAQLAAKKKEIQEYYSKRTRDERPQMKARVESTR